MTWIRLVLMLYFFMVEVYEDMVEILLVLEISLTWNA